MGRPRSLSSQFGPGQDCVPRAQVGTFELQLQSKYLTVRFIAQTGSPWQGKSLPSELLACLGLGRRGGLSYLGGRARAGVHPCEEVGDLSARGTAPPGPLAPASPAQQRVRARPVSRLRAEERPALPQTLLGGMKCCDV